MIAVSLPEGNDAVNFLLDKGADVNMESKDVLEACPSID